MELGTAGGVRQHGVLDDILVDGFDQRIVRHGLHKNRAIVMPGRSCHIDLQGEAAVLLQHLVVNVLNGLEPRHLGIVNVMRLVIEDGQFLDFADNLAKVCLAVGGLASGLGSEGIGQEVVAEIVVFERWLPHIAEENTVDVGQEDVARLTHHAHIVLNVQRKLKIIAPVLPGMAVVRQNGVIEEDFQPVEVSTQAIKHNDVRGDHEEVPRQLGCGFIELVEEAPGDEQ
jgi:hypothetical protein